MRAADKRNREHGFDPGTTLCARFQLSAIRENTEDRRTTSRHRRRFRAKTQKPLFDLPEFRMPGEDNRLEIVVVDGNTARPRSASPNLLLETN